MEIQYLKGVGPAVAAKLNKLNLFETKDALTFFPHSYQDRRKRKKIAQLVVDTDCFLVGKVLRIDESTKGNFHITKALLSDETGQISCIWFNQPFIKKNLKIDFPVFLQGKVEFDFLSHRKVIKVIDYEYVDARNIDRIVPIYPLTKGIYQKQLRSIIEKALELELINLKDPFPENIRQQHNLLVLDKAIAYFHYPLDEKTYLAAKHRLVFEDFFYLQFSLAINKLLTRKQEKGIAFKVHNTLSSQYFNNLPYKLTKAQERVISEVRADMQRDIPMNRLVQGDVGAGKTEIAMAAILTALENDYQVAIMAPTEILAYQHYQKMLKYLLPLGIRVELLVGSLQEKLKVRKQYLTASGSAQLLVGTHALIQDKVTFSNLGLAIIDEQHRFGVQQRSSLMKKSGEVIDLLVLTATPIPRSLTLTLYGDLDKSILDELPPGRTPIKTLWLKKMDKLTIDYIKSELDKGNQAYWVFPLVEESEKIDLKAATEGSQYLQNGVFQKYKVGLLHGKMKQKEKDVIMAMFRNKEIQVLVATTVIEVGVDVPDATVMVIEHGERFGLSQLHQLRGRIGRSNKPSTCILLSTTRTLISKRRLEALVSTTDGFKLAEVDLDIRGPGDYFGSKQSGLPTMLVANLIKDEKILLQAKQVATLLASDFRNPLYRPLIEALKLMPHLYVGLEGMN